MFDDGIDFIVFDVESVKVILEVDLEQYEFDSSVFLASFSQNGLWNVADVSVLHEDHHEQVGVGLIDGEQLLLGSEEDVAFSVDVGAIREVIVLHVIELVEDVAVEHVGEHVLLALESVVLHFWQNAL